MSVLMVLQRILFFTRKKSSPQCISGFLCLHVKRCDSGFWTLQTSTKSKYSLFAFSVFLPVIQTSDISCNLIFKSGYISKCMIEKITSFKLVYSDHIFSVFWTGSHYLPQIQTKKQTMSIKCFRLNLRLALIKGSLTCKERGLFPQGRLPYIDMTGIKYILSITF